MPLSELIYNSGNHSSTTLTDSYHHSPGAFRKGRIRGSDPCRKVQWNAYVCRNHGNANIFVGIGMKGSDDPYSSWKRCKNGALLHSGKYGRNGVAG